MPQSWGDTSRSKRGAAQIDRQDDRRPYGERPVARDDLSIHRRLPRWLAVILDRPLDDRYRR